MGHAVDVSEWKDSDGVTDPEPRYHGDDDDDVFPRSLPVFYASF